MRSALPLARLLVAGCALLLTHGSLAGATDYYVSKAGNDANPGTIALPWATVQHACSSLAPGDTAHVAAGTYNEMVTVGVSGSAGGGFVTLQADPGAVLDGTGLTQASLANTGLQDMILIDTQSYVQIVGFTIQNDIGVADGSGIRVLGSGDHISLLNNTIHGITGTDAMGITVYGTAATSISNLVIDGNVIYDCQPAQSETLTLNGNIDTFQITNNVVHDVNNIGIDMIGGETDIQPDQSLVTRNGVCSGNIVYNANSNYGGGYGDAIYIDGGQNIVVEHNIVYGSDIGIEVGAENAGVTASGIVVRDNLIYNNTKIGLAFGGYDPTVGRVNACQFLNNTLYQNDSLKSGNGEVAITCATNCTFENNIVYVNAQDLIIDIEYPADATGNSFNYNLYYADAGSAAPTFGAYTGFTAWETGAGVDASSIFANPLFLGASAADFHLEATSPSIGAGDPAFVVSGETDLDGNPRLLSGRVDMGCYERTSANPTVAAPSVTPGSGSFTGSLTVSLAIATVGALIYYTLDGSQPTATSTLYGAPFTLSATTTVKAIGVLSGYTNSAVASATFTEVASGATLGSTGGGIGAVGSGTTSQGATASNTLSSAPSAPGASGSGCELAPLEGRSALDLLPLSLLGALLVVSRRRRAKSPPHPVQSGWPFLTNSSARAHSSGTIVSMSSTILPPENRHADVPVSTTLPNEAAYRTAHRKVSWPSCIRGQLASRGVRDSNLRSSSFSKR